MRALLLALLFAIGCDSNTNSFGEPEMLLLDLQILDITGQPVSQANYGDSLLFSGAVINPLSIPVPVEFTLPPHMEVWRGDSLVWDELFGQAFPLVIQQDTLMAHEERRHEIWWQQLDNDSAQLEPGACYLRFEPVISPAFSEVAFSIDSNWQAMPLETIELAFRALDDSGVETTSAPAGSAIQLEMELVHPGGIGPVAANYSSGQTHDFFLYRGPDQLWRWSWTAIFPQEVWVDWIHPGQSRSYTGWLSLSDANGLALEPGEYVLWCWWPARGDEISMPFSVSAP
jgi:hypothetical protein